MPNEETTETVTRINALTAKFKALPWKMIAIGTAATAATAAVVILSKKLEDPAGEIEGVLTFEPLSVEILPDPID
jgi:hypothetical protein